QSRRMNEMQSILRANKIIMSEIIVAYHPFLNFLGYFLFSKKKVILSNAFYLHEIHDHCMQPNQLKTKPHYPILDGLRGVAAILVVIYHLFEAYFPVPANHPEHHGYLAVDFFYVLSGFVVGYAYDDRWNKMSIGDFFKRRLVRLHPLVILGTLIGAICFW